MQIDSFHSYWLICARNRALRVYMNKMNKEKESRNLLETVNWQITLVKLPSFRIVFFLEMDMLSCDKINFASVGKPKAEL